MNDLTDFLNARLDEDEATALAAVPGPWRWGDWSASFGTPELERNTLEYSPDHGPFPAPARLRNAGSIDALRLMDALEIDSDQEASAAHIARHDPARVLREVTAKRAIIAQYEGALSGCPPFGGPAPDLITMGLAFAIRALCSAYSDHPDYREEWKA